jgi:hypothetical protein
MEDYAPAAVLINSKHECLYYLGSTDHYLRVPTGHLARDLLAMARQRSRLYRSQAKVRSPYGVYDINNNVGWVSVGTDRDTASFAVNAIRRWRPVVGRKRYLKAND